MKRISFHPHLQSEDLRTQKSHVRDAQTLTVIIIQNTFPDTQSSSSPLYVVTGTYVTRVYSLFGESSSSLRFLDRRTRMRYGTFLPNKDVNVKHQMGNSEGLLSAKMPVLLSVSVQCFNPCSYTI